MASTGSVTAYVKAPPDEVFALVTSVDRLPEWNDVIRRVVEAPGELAPGAEWVVECSTLRMTWRSRSRLVALDPEARRFVHRSGTDDGNPSWAQWTWEVLAEGDGSRVTVTWELHPATVGRKALMAPMRARMLARREVPASLSALARVAEAG